MSEARTVEIDVLYDGEDIDEVANLLGMSREGVIDWHTSTEWTAAFGGFAPGFIYCAPANHADALSITLRSSSRTAFPASSVHIAGYISLVIPLLSNHS